MDKRVFMSDRERMNMHVSRSFSTLFANLATESAEREIERETFYCIIYDKF